MSPPLLRSLLFAPANHESRAEKALGLGADAVILDLEDACPTDLKVATRGTIAARLASPRTGLAYVRVNALGTAFGYGDLCAAVRPGLDGIVLPKLESAEELHAANWLLDQLEREAGMAPGAIDLLPIVETARGLSRLPAIVERPGRVRRLAFGAGDFTFDLGISWTEGETELAPYRAAMVLASRAGGLDAPIDTVWARIRDGEGCLASARTARAMGFGGKLCIHPDQIALVHRAFSPSPAEIAQAERVVAAFAAAEAGGSAALMVDGQFVDYPIVHRAHAILAAARATR